MTGEEAWHNGKMEQDPGEQFMSLWIAGSLDDVCQWWDRKEIGATKGHGNKGDYVGFRDTKEHAVERYQQRLMNIQKEEFSKEKTGLLEVRLDKDAFSQMATEKVEDQL